MEANILVVDDEESIRFSFQRFLSAEGHAVTTAGSYQEAVARIHNMKFDLILADIILDDGWGIDILHEVIPIKPQPRVIIMTAYPCVETAEASFSMHAADYLTKPLRQAALLHSVNKVLQDMERGEIARPEAVETGALPAPR